MRQARTVCVIEHEQGDFMAARRQRGSSGRRPRLSLRRGGPTALFVASACLLVAAMAATASSSYSDPSGDANEAPDIDLVTVDGAAQTSRITVRVEFGNFQVLPPNSRVILRFDLDRNEATGASGDEATIRYSSDGTLDFFRWNGADLVPLPASGMSAQFADGVFEYVVDRAQLGGATSFALIAVSARTQQAGAGLVVATDFAPGSGRSVYSSTGAMSFPDPDDDRDVAPDITSLAVSDTASGSIVFRISTANYDVLPPDKLLGIGIDLRGRPTTDDELFVGYLSGSRTVEVDREARGILQPAEGRHGITGSHADGVLTFAVPRRQLDGASAFDYAVVSADLVGPGESEGEEFEGEVEALDTAPDDLARPWYSYRLTNPGPLRLRAGRVSASPGGLLAGRPVTVWVPVRRLDTYRLVRSGSVRCTASLSGKRLRATGGLRGGRAECRLLPLQGRVGDVLRGTITVLTSGASLRTSYVFTVR